MHCNIRVVKLCHNRRTPQDTFLHTQDSLAHWRNQVFNTLLTIILLLGGIVAIPSCLLLIGGDAWPVAIIDFVALSWLAALRLNQRWDYRNRVLQFIAIVLLIGCCFMVTVGPSSQLYLVAAPVLAALLLGTEAGMITLLTGSIAIFIISYAGIGAVYLSARPATAWRSRCSSPAAMPSCRRY